MEPWWWPRRWWWVAGRPLTQFSFKRFVRSLAYLHYTVLLLLSLLFHLLLHPPALSQPMPSPTFFSIPSSIPFILPLSCFYLHLSTHSARIAYPYPLLSLLLHLLLLLLLPFILSLPVCTKHTHNLFLSSPSYFTSCFSYTSPILATPTSGLSTPVPTRLPAPYKLPTPLLSPWWRDYESKRLSSDPFVLDSLLLRSVFQLSCVYRSYSSYFMH